jgi:hypothetical protein
LEAVSVPGVQVIVYGLVATALAGVAAVLHIGLPLTPLVLRVSALTKPAMVAVKGGLTAPYTRDLRSAVTVRGALVTVRLPGTEVKV